MRTSHLCLPTFHLFHFVLLSQIIQHCSRQRSLSTPLFHYYCPSFDFSAAETNVFLSFSVLMNGSGSGTLTDSLSCDAVCPAEFLLHYLFLFCISSFCSSLLVHRPISIFYFNQQCHFSNLPVPCSQETFERFGQILASFKSQGQILLIHS